MQLKLGQLNGGDTEEAELWEPSQIDADTGVRVQRKLVYHEKARGRGRRGR